MKVPALAICAVLAFGSAPSQSTAPRQVTTRVEKPFKSGGTVRFDLTAGDYDIRGADAEAITISWRTRDARDDAKVRASADIRGTNAVVKVDGPHRSLHVRIEVPHRSDLNLDLSAGDLRIRNVEGNKSLTMWAGDVNIEAGSADLYRRVDASVRFGDLSAKPFGVEKEGVFRSFSWSGKGKYTLRAKLFAGDLTFVR